MSDDWVREDGDEWVQKDPVDRRPRDIIDERASGVISTDQMMAELIAYKYTLHLPAPDDWDPVAGLFITGTKRDVARAYYAGLLSDDEMDVLNAIGIDVTVTHEPTTRYISLAVRRRRHTLAAYVPSAVASRLQIPLGEVATWASAGKYSLGTPEDSALWRDFLEAAAHVGPERSPEVIDEVWRAERHGTSISSRIALEQTLLSMDRRGRQRVVIAGDWHGNFRWAKRALESVSGAEVRTVLHLGDFGLWPGMKGEKYLNAVTELCETLDVTILVTDGNHEDHHRLKQIPPFEGKRWLTSRIAFFERGHLEEMAGRRIVSLGGAPSVDYGDRVAGRTWWPEEVPTETDLERAVAHGSADILLTHDAPEPCTPVVAGIIRHNPLGLPTDALDYAAEGRRVVTEAFHSLKPQMLFHGHFHVSDQTQVTLPEADRPTRIYALDCDYNSGNLVTLNLEDLSVHPLHVDRQI